MLRVRRSQVRGSRILFDPSEGWKPQKVGVRTGNLPLRSQFRATQPEMWCVLSYGPQTRTHGAAPRAIQGQNWVFRVHGRAHVAKKTVLFIIGMVRKPIHGVQTCLQHMHICENWPFLGHLRAEPQTANFSKNRAPGGLCRVTAGPKGAQPPIIYHWGGLRGA